MNNNTIKFTKCKSEFATIFNNFVIVKFFSEHPTHRSTQSTRGRLSCCRAAGTREPHSCASQQHKPALPRLKHQRASENRRRTTVQFCCAGFAASAELTRLCFLPERSCASRAGNKQLTRLKRQRASENQQRTTVQFCCAGSAASAELTRLCFLPEHSCAPQRREITTYPIETSTSIEKPAPRQNSHII